MSSTREEDIDIRSEIVTEYRTLRRGDHLAVEGEIAGIKYYHHGIFLGHEKGVADFGGQTKTDAKLRNPDLMEFHGFGKRRLVRIIYPDGQSLPPESAAQNAEKLLQNPELWGPYNLLTNNCEHFATRCKTGRAVSHQVIKALRYCIENPINSSLGLMAASSSSAISGSLSSGSSSGSLSSGFGSLSFGSGSLSSGSGPLSFGSGSLSLGSGSLSFGSGSLSLGSGSPSFGSGALSSGSGPQLFGSGSLSSGSDSLPFGF